MTMGVPDGEGRIGVAIIGCGSMGEAHARSLAALEQVELKAFCDLREDAADRLSASAPGSYATTDIARVLRDDGIDAVYVCTQNDSHSTIGIASARAGKHIMMEKPIALNLRDCADLAEAVDRAGVRFMTAFKSRFSPAVRAVKDFVPNPFLCVAQMMDERWPDEFWGNDPVRGGGNVLSQGCHAVDLVCHLLGSDPVEVFAHGGNYHHQEHDIVDLISATLEFQNGSIGSLVLGDAGRVPLVSKFSFQVMDGVRTGHLFDRLKQAVLWDGTSERRHVDDREYGVDGENGEFVDAVLTGRSPSLTLHDGVRATAVLLRALESLRTGRPQRVVL